MQFRQPRIVLLNLLLSGMTGSTKQSGKKQAPVYSMTGRSKIGGFHEDLKKTPGPGAYNTTDPSTFKEKRPLYSMTSRNVMPGDSTQKPGPGAHSPERVGILTTYYLFIICIYIIWVYKCHL